MKSGIVLIHDADFDYCIHYQSTVQITVGGDTIDYTGQLYAYTDDYVLTEAGDRYLRLTCEFRTV